MKVYNNEYSYKKWEWDFLSKIILCKNFLRRSISESVILLTELESPGSSDVCVRGVGW